jgi:hypothetical protein
MPGESCMGCAGVHQWGHRPPGREWPWCGKAMAKGASEETLSTPLLSAQERCHDAHQNESPRSDFKASGVMPPAEVSRALASALPTRVKEVVTLLVNARQSTSSAVEVSFSRGMYLVSLTSKRRI